MNILKGKSSKVSIQLFRYLLAGAVAFGIDVAILYTLTEYANIYYLLSSVISFSVGLIVSYVISIVWVFDKRRIDNKTVELSIFIGIGTIGLVLTSLFMWLFTSLLLLHYLFSKILTTAIVFIWNFVAKKNILFTSKKKL